MALLRAAEYIKEEQDTHEFTLDFLDVPEGEVIPVLVINLNEKVRERARVAEQRFGGAEFRGFEQGEGYVSIKNDPVGYCTHILQKAYKDCTDLFDTPSKLAFLKLLERHPAVAKALAGAFIQFFGGDALIKKQRDDEDKKNSTEL